MEGGKEEGTNFFGMCLDIYKWILFNIVMTTGTV